MGADTRLRTCASFCKSWTLTRSDFMLCSVLYARCPNIRALSTGFNGHADTLGDLSCVFLKVPQPVTPVEKPRFKKITCRMEIKNRAEVTVIAEC